MREQAQSFVVLLLGGAILKIALEGAYLRYVKEGMQPFLLVAGGLLVLLGLATAFRGEPGRSNGVPEPRHDHDHAGPRVGWLLVLPLLAIFLVAPPALGSDAAQRDTGTVVPREGGTELPELEGVEVVEMDLAEFSYYAAEDGVDLAAETVRLTGFVSPDEAGGWYLTRMMIACCAADGYAVKVAVTGADPPPDDTWVEVQGTFVPSEAEDPWLVPPTLRVTDLREVPAPEQQYL